MTGPVRIDLHVHSIHSVDGRSTVAELAAGCASRSLGGFALTDHNSTAGHDELRAMAARHPGMIFLPGVEISTEVGHLLAYGIAEAPPAGVGLLASCEWVRSRGGVAVLAHPYRRPHGSGFRLPAEATVSAVEAVNGHTRRGANERASELAHRLAVPRTGGSDAHRCDELGTAFTAFPATCGSPDDLLDALRRGQVEAEGSSLGRLAWLRWGFRSGAARLARGLRSV